LNRERNVHNLRERNLRRWSCDRFVANSIQCAAASKGTVAHICYYCLVICMSNFLSNTGQLAVVRAHRTMMPHWLTHLGILGLFSVAVIDSSVIPLPLPGSTDLLLLWLVSHSGNPSLLALSAIAGSAVGGYTTWETGRRGGEAALSRHVPARLHKRIIGWVERHWIFAVFLPAMLPPPIPLLPFALAAGALGVSRNSFLAVYGSARSLRYSFVAWLGVAYGRRIVRMWSGTLQSWSTPLLCVFFGLAVVGACYGIWKMRGLRKADPSDKPALPA
jgi:membrane protein YqaA with SNARE-associated domain